MSVPGTETRGCLNAAYSIPCTSQDGLSRKNATMENKAVPSFTRVHGRVCAGLESGLHSFWAPGQSHCCSCWSYWSHCPATFAIITEWTQTPALLSPPQPQRERGCTCSASLHCNLHIGSTTPYSDKPSFQGLGCPCHPLLQVLGRGDWAMRASRCAAFVFLPVEWGAASGCHHFACV